MTHTHSSVEPRDLAPLDGDPVLRVEGLQTHFPVQTGLLSAVSDEAVRAVDGVTFDVAEGEVFGLVGESGSGKTTLGRTILRLVAPTAGHIWYRGKDLAQMSQRDVRPLRRDLGLIFQDPASALNPAMTIGQGVGHPLRIHGLTSSRRETRQRVAEMLERVGLSPAENFLDKYPEDVSGGQKQRLVLARTLITNPRFVVADEPVASLDMSIRARVLELMLELKDELGLTYLFITHDLATARFMCDRIAILYLGRFVEVGPYEQIFHDPKHPYTRSLLEAIPLPDPSRRGRDKHLPRGEIPNAVSPPAGCRFHPRCRDAFEVCGWEGRDFLEALEERWTQVDEDTFERELELVGGDLDAVTVERDVLRFPAADADQLATWLRAHGEELPTSVYKGVSDVTADGNDVVVRFRSGPDPDTQHVAGREVACHLHGVTVREDGRHVGDPDPEEIARFDPPTPSWER